jgi:hypothetical protein
MLALAMVLGVGGLHVVDLRAWLPPEWRVVHRSYFSDVAIPFAVYFLLCATDADGPPPRSIAVKRAQIVLPHQPSDAMLAAGLACLTQVQEDPRRAVDPLPRSEGRANQPQQPRILLGAVRERVLAPLGVAARRHLEDAAHDLH